MRAEKALYSRGVSRPASARSAARPRERLRRRRSSPRSRNSSPRPPSRCRRSRRPDPRVASQRRRGWPCPRRRRARARRCGPSGMSDQRGTACPRVACRRDLPCSPRCPPLLRRLPAAWRRGGALRDRHGSRAGAGRPPAPSRKQPRKATIGSKLMRRQAFWRLRAQRGSGGLAARFSAVPWAPFESGRCAMEP